MTTNVQSTLRKTWSRQYVFYFRISARIKSAFTKSSEINDDEIPVSTAWSILEAHLHASVSQYWARNLQLSIFVWLGRAVLRHITESCLGSLSDYQNVNNSRKVISLPAVTTVMIPCTWGQRSTVTALENSRRRKARPSVVWVITHVHSRTAHAANSTRHNTRERHRPVDNRGGGDSGALHRTGCS